MSRAAIARWFWITGGLSLWADHHDLTHAAQCWLASHVAFLVAWWIIVLVELDESDAAAPVRLPVARIHR